MDLSVISTMLSNIDPLILGGGFGGILVIFGVAFTIKKIKGNKKSATDFTGQTNSFKTLRTEDLEKEFGSLTVQTKLLEEDDSDSFAMNNEQSQHQNGMHTANISESGKLIDEALVYDGFNKIDQALESLKKSLEVETYEKERVRLKTLIGQYENKKGKISLEQLVQQYPSFHQQTQQFDSNNTISALMSPTVPRSDTNLYTKPEMTDHTNNTTVNNTPNNINTKTSNDAFDMFADIPVLTEIIPTKNETTKNETTKEDKQLLTDIFSDLPNFQTTTVQTTTVNTEQTHHLTNNQENEHSKNNHNALFDELPQLEQIAKKETYNSIPQPTNTIKMENNSLFDDLPSLDNNSHSKVNIPASEQPHNETNKTEQFDQFSWNKPEVLTETLPEISTDIDKPTIEDATEKMLQTLQQDATAIDHANQKQDTEDTQKFWKEFGNMVADINQNINANTTHENQSTTEQKITSTSQFHSVPADIPELLVIKSTVTPATTQIPANNSVKESVDSHHTNNTNSHKPTIQTGADGSKTKIIFKVWANWIVQMDGKQVYQNRFVNLKSPWGSTAAAEELFSGITKMCSTGNDGKSHPWVMVSVFPVNQ